MKNSVISRRQGMGSKDSENLSQTLTPCSEWQSIMQTPDGDSNPVYFCIDDVLYPVVGLKRFNRWSAFLSVSYIYNPSLTAQTPQKPIKST